MYTLDSDEVKITDEGFFISVLNKKTGQIGRAKNFCGYVNGRMDFALSYPGKPNNLCDIAAGRVEALSELLKHLDLPTYRTLKKHATRKEQM